MSFDCNDDDLNEFFRKDSSTYASHLLAVTCVFETKTKTNGETVAFFSVLNDKIQNRDSRGKIIANKLMRRIPNPKRRPTYPAVKVGRFAVNIKYQRQGIGSKPALLLP